MHAASHVPVHTFGWYFGRDLQVVVEAELDPRSLALVVAWSASMPLVLSALSEVAESASAVAAVIVL